MAKKANPDEEAKNAADAIKATIGKYTDETPVPQVGATNLSSTNTTAPEANSGVKPTCFGKFDSKETKCLICECDSDCFEAS